MKRKRKKWARRIVPIILSMALSVSAFSGFYHPVYAEDEIIQEASSEELPPDQIEIFEPEESLTEQENGLDELLPNQTTETVTEEATEAVTEEATEAISEVATEEVTEAATETVTEVIITEAVTEDNTESNLETQVLNAEAEYDEQAIDPEEATDYEGAWAWMNEWSNDYFQYAFGSSKEEYKQYMENEFDLSLRRTTYPAVTSRRKVSSRAASGSVDLYAGSEFSVPYSGTATVTCRFYATNNELGITGFEAFCINPERPTTATGTYQFDRESNTAGTSGGVAARAMYLAYEKPDVFAEYVNTCFGSRGLSYDLDGNNKAFLLHRIVSKAYGGLNGQVNVGLFWNNPNTTQENSAYNHAFIELYDKIAAYADLPVNYMVYHVHSSSAGQDVVFSGFDELPTIVLRKVSANPDYTEHNQIYSLAGAEYQVYTDSACTLKADAIIVESGKSTGKTNALLTTTADGSTNVLNLAKGIYYIKEVTASPGYDLDTTIHRVDLQSYTSGDPYEITSTEPLATAKIILKKVSSNTTVTTNNRMYSLAGAEYQVYTDAVCTVPANALIYNAAGEITGTTNALLTTTADGTTNTLYLARGIYYVKETKASPGYTLDRAVKQVDLRNYTSTDPYQITSTEKPVGDPAELVLTKTDSEGITMVRAGADGSAITNFGNATLEGAVFKVSYFDDLYDSNSISGKTPKAVWYIETQYSQTYSKYIAKLDPEHLATDYTSSDFYIIDGDPQFPLGTVTFEEFRPASGYKNLDEGGVMTHAGGVAEDNMTIMQIRMNGTSASAYVEDPATNEYTTNADGTRIHVFTTAQDGSEISVQEDIKRSDLAFQKLHYVTHQPMANVFFRITSSTGESHIIKTDANGYFTSDSAEISHLTNTNGYDDVYQVEDDSAALTLGDCGVWFYGTDNQTEWNTALIDDAKGAFRYDEEYILQELPCTANRGMQMLPPITVSLTRDNRLTYIGSLTNVPVPELHTMEWDEYFGEGSHTSVIQDGVVSAIHDTISYKYLTENTTYTFKTILMELDADGELIGPLLDAEGNMIRANTVITTPASMTASVQSICDTVDVKLEIIASAGNNTLKDKRFVIFEYLYEGEDQELIEVDADGNPVPGNTVAEHADSTDENQIGYFLDIHTKLLQHDNTSQDAKISDSMLVSDQVTYNGLDTMNEYRLEAVLKLVDSEGNEIGDIIDADGTPITAVKYFIPDEVSGTVQVDFPEFDGYQVISNNRILGNIVAYETLYMGRRTLVKHHNPKDQDQTLYVRPQGRIRVYKTGDQVVAATQYTSVYGDFHRLSFDQKPLAGTEFEIHSAMDDSLIETIVTDRTGYAESSDLAWGEYYLIETRTRKGLIRSADPIAVTLLCPENYRGYWYYEKIDVENAVGDTEINVYKQGEILDIENKAYSFGRKPLEGVIFGVYAAEPILDYAGDPVIQSDECIGFIRTGADGKAAMRDALVEGRYYYKEIHTLDGYMLDETKHEFQLVLGNEELTSFDVNKENPDVNQLYKTKLQLTKRDSKDGHTISGVEFALYNEKDECMGIYVTDEQGRILIDDLPYGRYYFVEQKAAKGYVLDSSHQDFTAEAAAASMDVTNDRIPDTPKTGDPTPMTPVTAAGALMAVLACILAVVRLRQNRLIQFVVTEDERTESEGKEGNDYEQGNYDGTTYKRSGGTVFTRSKSDSGGKVLSGSRPKIQARGRAGGGLL